MALLNAPDAVDLDIEDYQIRLNVTGEPPINEQLLIGAGPGQAIVVYFGVQHTTQLV